MLVDAEDVAPVENKYVVSVIDEVANVKKITYGPDDQICLISESTEKYLPIFIHRSDLDHYHIMGTVFNVIKSPA